MIRTVVSCIFFLCFARLSASTETICDTSDCKRSQLLADINDDEHAIKMLQLKGSKMAVSKGSKMAVGKEDPRPEETADQPNCPMLESPIAQTGKGCPELADSCLNGNKQYTDLEQAWTACAKEQECGAILSTAEGNFYLRRLSDPDLPEGSTSKSLMFSCPSREVAKAEKPSEKELDSEDQTLPQKVVPPKPHIVFVLTDDLGWNTAWNNDEIVSPTLNSMAANGLKLHSHYAYRYCSPTRAAFLTGRSPYKLLNIRKNTPSSTPESTDLRFTMLPKRLREAGYYSYQIGKWHQGVASPSFLPVARGFQESYGFLQGTEDHYTQIGGQCTWGGVTDCFAQGGDYPGQGGPISSCDVPVPDRVVCPLFGVISKNESIAKAKLLCAAGRFANCAFDNASDPRSVPCFQCKTRRYNGYDQPAHAVRVISKHDTMIPMFMYLAIQNTHGPYQAPTEYEALYNFSQQKRNTFNAMVSVVDSAVANVTAALKRRGMWNNTLLIWTTDNGAPVQEGGSNAPLKGGKGTDWEGGTRVPAFISGGFLPKRMSGKTLNGIVAVWDYFATFCRLAGIDPAEPQKNSPTPVDSFDLWPYLSGDVYESPRQEIVYDHLMFQDDNFACSGYCLVAPCNGAGAIRVGDYKLLIGNHGCASHYGQFSPNETWSADLLKIRACSMEQPCLFNVSGDIAEEYDLARERPEVVTHLLQRFHAYDTEYHPPSKTPENEDDRFCEAALNNGGFIKAWHSNDDDTIALM